MDMKDIAAATGIERVQVLHGHTSQETAYLQDDYPYGRQLRCQRRIWLEEATKGAARGQFRFVTQTSNPKRNNDWNNKPHPSTYLDWAVLIRLPEKEDRPDDYISWTGFGIWGPTPAEEVRFHVSGIYEQLTDGERVAFDRFVKLNEHGNRNSRERWNDEVIPAFKAYYQEHGEFPALENSVVLGQYVPERDYQSACAAVLMDLG